MARKKATPAEKDAKKLARRLAKKQARTNIKNEIAQAISPVSTTRKRKNQSDVKLIEVLLTDKASIAKLSQYQEVGAMPIKKVAFIMGHIVYEVPFTLQGFTEHGKGLGDTTPVEIIPQRPMKTISNLADIINERITNKEKINKRQIKLLVRGSELKRSDKKSTLAKLLSQFKIK